MRRVLFLAVWLIATFLSPVTLSYTPKQPEVELKLTSLTPVFHVALAQVAADSAESTASSLDVKSTYTLSAEKGDGITHLARKAVHEYLSGSEKIAEYGRAERIHLEDFLQNRIGTYGLEIGQSLKFTVGEIEEALTAVGAIDTSNLEASLARYVSRVSWDKYESLQFARAEVTDANGIVQDDDQENSATTDEKSDSTSDNEDIEAAKTENSNTNRQRTITYIIIVLVILIVAGYLLFKGTNDDDSGTPKMDDLKNKEREVPKKTETKKDEPKVLTENQPEKVDYTKTENKEDSK